MPTYKVTNPDTGQTIKLTGDSPPTEQELEGIFAEISGGQAQQIPPQQAQPQPMQQPAPMPTEPQVVAAQLQQVPNAMSRGSGRGGMIKGEQARQDMTSSQQLEELRRTNPARAELLESIGPGEAALIGLGSGFTKIGRGLGLADEAMEGEQEMFSELEAQQPTATAGEIAGEVLPFVPAGVQLGAIASLPLRSLAGGALGATEGGILAKGMGLDEQTTGKAAGIGGAVGAGVELLFPVIGRLGGSVVRRVTGKAPKGRLIDDAGRPTQELQSALERTGATYDDLTKDAKSLLDVSAGADPDEIARKAFLESQGLTPTRAQISRDASEFQAQQELAKTSNRVRDAIEAQDATLTTRFNQAVLDTGGQADTPTSTVTDALVGKATVLDQEISDLYKLARETAPGEQNIRFDALANQLRKSAPKNRVTGGAVEAIVGDLQEKGVLDESMKVVGKIDVETAEDVRKLMNELYDSQNGFRNSVLRNLKDSLDEDVFKAAGDDVYKQARKAKTDFEKELSRAKVSKFDSRKTNIVRDVLENKINPDSFADDVVFSKKYRAEDLKQLKDYISTDDAGKMAFDDMRADVLTRVKEKAFIGAEDAAGNRSLSRNTLEKELKRIGKDKLNVLFTAPEQKFLNDMLKVAKLREPVRGTALGKGPSAQGVAALEKRLANLPMLGALIDLIDIDASGRMAIRAKPAAVKELTKLERDLPRLAQPGLVGGAVALETEQ